MNEREEPWLLFLCTMICISLHINMVLGTDTLSANQSLSGDQTIVSIGQVFELGFFSPGNSKNYYVGIWYKKITPRIVVWVANREQPVSDKNTAHLKISDGNLVMFKNSDVPIWSTNMSSTINNISQAILLDSGNLVLTSGSKTSQFLWQSFDYPTDTWLPGGKLRFDKRKNQSQLLTSWKNSKNAAPGLFSLELDPIARNSYSLVWNQSVQYWSSGSWDGYIFSLVPEMRLNFLYNFSFVENDDESYFTCNMYDTSTLSLFVMEVTGELKVYEWLPNSQVWNLFWTKPRQQCVVYDYCGAFGSCDTSQTPCSCLQGFKPKSDSDWNLQDYSNGCERKTALQCGTTRVANGDKDKFLSQLNVTLPDHQQKVGNVSSVAACEASCLNNCSCTAYTFDSSGCSISIGNVFNLQRPSTDDSPGKTIYIRLAASEFPKKKNHTGMISGILVGVSVLVLAVAIILFIVLRQRKRTAGTGKTVDGSLVAFGYRDLQNATKNFSEKLGGGGFGSVFKGMLSDSSVVAVKKLESISQGEKQFRTEVCTIGIIQHVNLVRLRGFCSEGSRKLLVYDYMPNGSVDSHLFVENNNQILDWETRYQIALGTARGLAYLHEKCRDCIIHCDIKPENILLDADYVPKVADFGLAKMVGRDFSRVLTTMRGTRGYLAPEWISGLAITAKADVYSYGMMLFEFVSGRRNSDPSEDYGKVKFLPSWAASVISEGGDVYTLLDSRLEGEANTQELTRVCQVACWCVQDDESHRPTMGQVVQILEGIMDVNSPPLPRFLQLFDDDQDHIIFFTDSSTDQSPQSRTQITSASSLVKSNISSASVN